MWQETLDGALLVLPPAIYLSFFWAYRSTLKRQRDEVTDLKLDKAQDAAKTRPLEIFDEHYGECAYVFPLVAVVLVAMATTILFLAHAALPRILDAPLQTWIRTLPSALGPSLLGAHLWGFSRLLFLLRDDDVSPSAFHETWIHLLMGPSVACLASWSTKDGLDPLVAFGIGLLPLRILLDYATGAAKKALAVTSAPVKAEPPSLDKIQGMTADMIEYFADEDVTSPMHLACADPIRLILMTGIDRELVLDFIGQALLFVYVGDAIDELRRLGFRNALDFQGLARALDSKPTTEETKLIVASLAAALAGKPENKSPVESLVRRIKDDRRVQLIQAINQAAYRARGVMTSMEPPPEAPAGVPVAS